MSDFPPESSVSESLLSDSQSLTMETRDMPADELKFPKLEAYNPTSKIEAAVDDDPTSLAIIVTDKESWKRKSLALSETSQRQMPCPDEEHSRSLCKFEIPFTQPALDPSFMAKVETQNICLQNLLVNESEVFGVVKVKNLAFKKQVIVKYTMTGWNTQTDVICEYDKDSHTDSHDTFTFTIVLPKLSSHKELEFVLKYVVNGEEYWDNNSGKKYVLYSEALEPGFTMVT